MKTFILFITALCIALPAAAAPKKDDKEKDKKAEKKEIPPQMWNVVVEGATGDTAAQEVKGFLSLMKDVKVESCEIKGTTVEAVISSRMRVSRSDISKALRENKELKLKDFKLQRPDRDGKAKDKEKEKEQEKEADAKPEETKTPDAATPKKE